MSGARKPKLPRVTKNNTPMITAAIIKTLMTREIFPGSLLTRARIIK